MTTVSSAEITGTAQWRRLSPRMLLVHPVIELIRALPAVLGALLAGSSSGGGSRWGLVAAGVVIFFAVLRWFTTRFRISPEQIQLRHGLLRRVTVAAPTDRVRTVDVTAHALHRALGLAKVVIGTGTSDRKGRGGLVLDGLTAAAAARLRDELLHRNGSPAQVTTEVAAAEAGEEELVRLHPAWIRYAPCTLSGAVTSAAVAGFLWRLDSEANLHLSRLGPLRSIGEQLRQSSIVLDVAAGVVAVVVLVAAASTIGYALAFWRFRLTRHPGGSLRVTRGLVTTRATSIERRRLRGAELSEPLLLRAVGGARCLVIATGLRVGRGAERGGEVLLPPAPREVALAVTAAVLDTGAPMTAALTPHPPAARRRRLSRALGAALVLVLLVGALVPAGLSPYAWFASLSLPVLAVPLALDRFRALGHAVVGGYLVTRLGSVVRRRSAIACDGVIGWNLRSSYFQRRAGLTTLTATTAAGRQGYAVVDVTPAEALRFADAVRPGLLVQFLQP
ncbi:MAG: putative rane protein [Pseudonocardiales bacterium]|nr:putative rane protein [Pseudonocardiales bacterium]